MLFQELTISCKDLTPLLRPTSHQFYVWEKHLQAIGLTEVIVASQMDAVLATLNDEDFAKAMHLNMVFAYEPVWAVERAKPATPEQAQEVHQFIRQRIARRNAEAASKVRIIYGGSVKAQNAEKLFSMPDVDMASWRRLQKRMSLFLLAKPQINRCG